MDENEIIRLCGLTSFNGDDKRSCLDIIKKHIDPLANYCLSCDGSVRAMFRRLRFWWSEKDKG